MKPCSLNFVLILAASISAGAPMVTGICAVHRHGQTFVTCHDAAEGDAGARFRYSLYRAAQPITQENLPQAQPCYHGVLNHSGRLFGTAFNAKDRLDAAKPMAVLKEGGTPLPAWSGLAVHTVRQPGKAYYAVVATDLQFKRLTRIAPGQSATLVPLDEAVAPIQPIKLYDCKKRGIYTAQTLVTGQKNLPLFVELHASQGQGGGAGDYGDYHLYFANADMGYRDGLPGVFSVEERRAKTGNTLYFRNRDAIEHPSGTRAMETYWFGYDCVPQGAGHAEPRAYPLTEKRLDWILDWVIRKYHMHPEHVAVGGGSMGAWGSASYGLRRTRLFVAVYPNRPRTRQRGLPSLGATPTKGKTVFMPDGKTDYYERMDMVKFAALHPEDLAFLGWCCGRRDGFATWQEQVDMVRALSKALHGFAFAWNNGDHSSGAQPMEKINKQYPASLFARNQSYPAFRNSSIDQDPGNGDPKDGDLEGGINLGFRWKDVKDEPDSWSVTLGNDLAAAEMTVDVTLRRCQKFKAKPGDTVKWSASNGDAGTLTADDTGLVTVPRLRLTHAADTTLRLTK
jgi:hypothetical protein